MAAETEATYCACYRYEPTPENEAVMQAVNDRESPQTLAEIIDTCRETGAKAELKDEAGWTRGWVHADGTYRLQ